MSDSRIILDDLFSTLCVDLQLLGRGFS